MNKSDIAVQITGGKFVPGKETGTAFAPSNIALCKYWGKRDKELNLPATSSLSISLGELGTHTSISKSIDHDVILLNGKPAPLVFANRLSAFLNLFRTSDQYLKVETNNNIPTAAGLASSASGFAALVLALNDLAGWNLPVRQLSVLARMGSGSACRSLYHGFVLWNRGEQNDGMDSYAESLSVECPAFCLGIVEVSKAQKPIGSTDAMNRTSATSRFYEQWPARVNKDIDDMLQALHSHDFERIGRIAEANALAMHATMIDSWPPVLYWQPETVSAMHRVWALRDKGIHVYFTIDAGPNVKLLFMESDADQIKNEFPGLEIVKPFG